MTDRADDVTGGAAGGLGGIPTLLSLKFIDDTTVFYPARLEDATRHITAATTDERFEALPLIACQEEVKRLA